MTEKANVDAAIYPEPDHVLVHLSDTHFVAGPGGLYGKVATDQLLTRVVAQLERMGGSIDGVVVTGDIADRGEPEAYRRVRRSLEALAGRLGTELIWVMGNHDQRDTVRRELLDEASDDRTFENRPLDTVTMVGGLRVVSLDSSVPGFHHGDLGEGQLGWLDRVLSKDAPHGTVIAMHHPPLPTPIKLMRILELQHQDEFAAVLAGRDVRAIISGHLHYPTTGLFGGVPVFSAGAVSYTIDVSASAGDLRGVDGGQTFQVISLYRDRVVAAVVPIGDAPVVARFDEEYVKRIETLDAAGQLDAFSRIPPPAPSVARNGR